MGLVVSSETAFEMNSQGRKSVKEAREDRGYNKTISSFSSATEKPAVSLCKPDIHGDLRYITSKSCLVVVTCCLWIFGTPGANWQPGVYFWHTLDVDFAPRSKYALKK